MFYNIEIPKIVHKDIFELTRLYIFRLSYSIEISQKIYDNLYSAIFSLDFMPYRNEIYYWEYRRIIVNWNYKIIYKVNEEDKKVIIIRIFRVERMHNLD